jgi:hypothetical protein
LNEAEQLPNLYLIPVVDLFVLNFALDLSNSGFKI